MAQKKPRPEIESAMQLGFDELMRHLEIAQASWTPWAATGDGKDSAADEALAFWREAWSERAQAPIGMVKGGLLKRRLEKAVKEDDFDQFKIAISEPGAPKLANEVDWLASPDQGGGLRRVDLAQALLGKGDPRWMRSALRAGMGLGLDAKAQSSLAKKCVEIKMFDLAGDFVDMGADCLAELPRDSHSGAWRASVALPVERRRDLLAYAVAQGDSNLVRRMCAKCDELHRHGDERALPSLLSAQFFSWHCWEQTREAKFTDCAGHLGSAIDAIRDPKGASAPAKEVDPKEFFNDEEDFNPFEPGEDEDAGPKKASHEEFKQGAADEFVKLARSSAEGLQAQVERLTRELAVERARADRLQHALDNPTLSPRFTRWRGGAGAGVEGIFPAAEEKSPVATRARRI